MSYFWLTPVESDDPLVLGAERLRIPGGPPLDGFRQRLAERFHARLLPLVKASILPSDPEEEAAQCGNGEAPDLNTAVSIVFDGSSFGLSECGRAFVDRLPGSKEQEDACAKALGGEVGDWSAEEREWLLRMLEWARMGQPTMLVKED
ncbi:hypothetical protein [Gorillibacterium sp. sgz5001074]|uniref:hypothetical protein n=1 Tax=Gorillibacterium sp. sgz5001074 TaxID=3446695 RepID=UPI003F6658B5